MRRFPLSPSEPALPALPRHGGASHDSRTGLKPSSSTGALSLSSSLSALPFPRGASPLPFPSLQTPLGSVHGASPPGDSLARSRAAAQGSRSSIERELRELEAAPGGEIDEIDEETDACAPDEPLAP